MFNVPVALFIFKRTEKSVQIMEEISKVAPKKVYLISDAGRNDKEQLEVDQCRKAVENAVNWDCELVRMYEETNQGCYNIGVSAMKIFEKEKTCIFLEDDNLPCNIFFEYCKELLERYEENDDILWICGTNYMSTYVPQDGSDYVFTQHMLPCGWASWSKKFNKYYEYDFQHLNKEGIARAGRAYRSKRLFRYDLNNWQSEIRNKAEGRYASWDYHMNFTLRYHNKLGIAPKYNQITNIGADSAAAHGGVSMENYLTSKFCMVPIKQLSLPLKHPNEVKLDSKFEKETEKIIVPPRSYYLKIAIRRLIPIPRDISIKKSLRAGRIIRKGEQGKK